MYVRMYVCTYVCMYVCIYIYIHIYIYVRVCVCVCMYVAIAEVCVLLGWRLSFSTSLNSFGAIESLSHRARVDTHTSAISFHPVKIRPHVQ